MSKKSTYQLAIVAALLCCAIVAWVSWRVKHQYIPEERSKAEAVRSTPAVLGGNEKSAALPPPPHSLAEYNNNFSKLGVLEASAVMTDIGQKDLETILRLFFETSRLDRDYSKLSGIATKLAYALRRQKPDAVFIEKLHRAILDESNNRVERGFLLGSASLAATKESIELLVALLPDLATDAEFRNAALKAVGSSGTLWGDGGYHEERSVPLEKAWRESTDGILLSYVAQAMAEIGAPSSVDLLLSAAAQDLTGKEPRARIAITMLGKVYQGNAVPAVAAFLRKQATTDPASRLAGRILVLIGDRAAASELGLWLQGADDGAAGLVPELVFATRTENMEIGWEAMIDPSYQFRSEKTREAIRVALEKYKNSRRHGSVK